MALDLEAWGAGLVIPAAKLGKGETGLARAAIGPVGDGRSAGGILHGLEEVVAGGRRAVMTLHVEGHAGPELLRPEQGLQGPDHFGPLFIDGGGIKIIDGLILIRLDRVGRGARIFTELAIAQEGHILDALDGRRMEIGGETGITKHREPFFQRKLEPVAAGDAVAGPVMEILVGDHTFDPLQFAIGGGGGIGEHQLGIKDIETLIFHGAHVEVAHGNDVEFIEVVFQPIHLLIPGHGAFQRRHRMGGVGAITRLHVDAQGHLAATGGGEGIAHLLELARHQGEEVGGFGEGVVPDGVVAGRIVQGPGADAVAIREQHGAALPVGLDPHPEATEQVGAIGVVSDAAEALGLALAGHHAAAHVEPLQAAVGFRVDAHQRLELEGPLRRRQQHQGTGFEPVRVRGQQLPIEAQLQQLQAFAAEVHRARSSGRVGPALEAGRHQAVVLKNLHRQVGAIQPKGSRAVISETNQGHGANQGFPQCVAPALGSPVIKPSAIKGGGMVEGMEVGGAECLAPGT